MKGMMSRDLVLFACAVTVSAETPPGLPDMTFPEDELFTVISHFPTVRHGEDGLPDNPTYAMLVNGYPVLACDEGSSVLDLSDPYNPELVSTYWYPDDMLGEPEYDSWGMTTGYGGVHAVRMDTTFLEIMDYTDPRNPTSVSQVGFPDPHHPADMDPWRPGWGYLITAAWQAPYLYSSMRLVGIDIVDVHDIENPQFVKRFDAGFGPGSVHVVGNLLVEAKYNGTGMATYDISDPVHPVLLDTETKGEEAKGWQVWVNGNRLFRSGGTVHMWDISDPADMQFVKTFERSAICINTGEGSHGHCASGGTDTQDGFLFLGGSHFGVFKWDIESGEEVGYSGAFLKPEGERREDWYDLDYPSVFGNLVIGSSEDHYQGTFFIPHQTEPDRTPPKVNMVNPRDEAQDMATTTRIGFTFTDAIDHRSVTTETIIVRPEGGEALNGKFSLYKSIVNFSPDVCLEKNTCYEVVVPARGVKDYAGNATAEEFTSTFCTGEAQNDEVCAKRAANPTRTAPARKAAAGKCGSSPVQRRAFMHRPTVPRGSARIYDIRGRLTTSMTASAAGGTGGVYIIVRTEGNRVR